MTAEGIRSNKLLLEATSKVLRLVVVWCTFHLLQLKMCQITKLVP